MASPEQDILESSIDEFCESSYFLLLDPSVKERGAGILAAFVAQAYPNRGASTENVTAKALEDILMGKLSLLELPLAAKLGIPALLGAFFRYLCESGKYPPASDWELWINSLASAFGARLRPDGTMRGKSFKKNYTDVSRNDPCPCGSGKKFKKCCMNLIS